MNQHSGGGNKVTSNDRGNSADYTRKRLKRDRPDLLERVAEGELSANVAAIEAGFRKVKTPLEAAKTAVAKLSPADRAREGISRGPLKSEMLRLSPGDSLPRPNRRTKSVF